MRAHLPFPAIPPPALRPEGKTVAHSITLKTYSYDDRHTLLTAVATAMACTGCWILNRKHLSLTELEIQFEVQLRSVLDLYSGLIGAGLELTRDSHLELTSLCTLRRHKPSLATLGTLVHVRLSISFLEELELQSVLLPTSARA